MLGWNGVNCKMSETQFGMMQMREQARPVPKFESGGFEKSLGDACLVPSISEKWFGCAQCCHSGLNAPQMVTVDCGCVHICSSWLSQKREGQQKMCVIPSTFLVVTVERWSHL